MIGSLLAIVICSYSLSLIPLQILAQIDISSEKILPEAQTEEEQTLFTEITIIVPVLSVFVGFIAFIIQGNMQEKPSILIH